MKTKYTKKEYTVYFSMLLFKLRFLCIIPLTYIVLVLYTNDQIFLTALLLVVTVSLTDTVTKAISQLWEYIRIPIPPRSRKLIRSNSTSVSIMVYLTVVTTLMIYLENTYSEYFLYVLTSFGYMLLKGLWLSTVSLLLFILLLRQINTD